MGWRHTKWIQKGQKTEWKVDQPRASNLKILKLPYLKPENLEKDPRISVYDSIGSVKLSPRISTFLKALSIQPKWPHDIFTTDSPLTKAIYHPTLCRKSSCLIPDLIEKSAQKTASIVALVAIVASRFYRLLLDGPRKLMFAKSACSQNINRKRRHFFEHHQPQLMTRWHSVDAEFGPWLDSFWAESMHPNFCTKVLGESSHVSPVLLPHLSSSPGSYIARDPWFHAPWQPRSVAGATHSVLDILVIVSHPSWQKPRLEHTGREHLSGMEASRLPNGKLGPCFVCKKGMEPTPLHMRVGKQALLARLRTPGQQVKPRSSKWHHPKRKNQDINRVATRVGVQSPHRKWRHPPKSTTL